MLGREVEDRQWEEKGRREGREKKGGKRICSEWDKAEGKGDSGWKGE